MALVGYNIIHEPTVIYPDEGIRGLVVEGSWAIILAGRMETMREPMNQIAIFGWVLIG